MSSTQELLVIGAPTSHGAVPKIKSPPHESVDKLQDYDDFQPSKNKEFDLRGSNPTPHKDKVHSTHKHHRENQSVPTPSEDVIMHKDRPPFERSRHADGTNENTRREARDPKSASQKDRPHSERKQHHGMTHDEFIVQRISLDGESKPTPQKIRPHTERKHQGDKHDDVSPSLNDIEDKDSRHARHKVKHSGRKHHGDKCDDKESTPKSSGTHVNKETTDTTCNSPKERSQLERKQDSDAEKSSQNNVSKEKKKIKPSSVHTSNKVEKGNHADKYEGLPIAPNDNDKIQTRTSICNKGKDVCDHKHKKIHNIESGGKITKSNHDISLIFPDEDGNKSVMRIVVRSFASPTRSQNCVDVKIEGEKFNSSNVHNPEIENLIRELTKYVIQIQKKLEENNGGESKKARKDQHKEVIELFRRPDKTFVKKEVDKPTKSRVELGISLKFIPSGTEKETKLAQESDKKQENSKLNSTSKSNDSNTSSLQTNSNWEVDKSSIRKKDMKELKPESSRSKKGVEQEIVVVDEDRKEATKESSGQEDGGKSKENAQEINEKRVPNLESKKSERVDSRDKKNKKDKKDAKKRGSKRHHCKGGSRPTSNNPEGEGARRESNSEGAQPEEADLGVHKKKSKRKRISGQSTEMTDVSAESEDIPRGEDERRESNPESDQPEEADLGVHKKKSKRKRISEESTETADVSAESENIPREEDVTIDSNPESDQPEEVGTIPEEKQDAINQESDNIDNVNPKKPKTKDCTESTCQTTKTKDQTKKHSGSKEEGSEVPKSPADTKQDSKKHVDKKMSMASVKKSVSKILVKLTASKTTVAEGLTAAIRQKHKAKKVPDLSKDMLCKNKKSRTKVGERLSLKGVQIPVLFEEVEPTLQSKSSVKILLEHTTEEGNLCLNLIGIRKDDTQDFGGRIQFNQSGMTPKKKCEDVETMKELLSNCVKKVENVLNNLYQDENETLQYKHTKKVQLATTERESIEEAPEQKKIGGIMKKPSSTSMDYAHEMSFDASKRNESSRSLASISSKADRRISFKDEPIDLPFVGMKQDSEISEDECSGGPNGECNECEVDEEDAQYSKDKDVNDIIEAKLDAGEFDREARKSFQRELFSASLKDPDAIERYRRSHSKLSLDTVGEQTDHGSGVAVLDQTNEAPDQTNGAALDPSWETNDSLDNPNSKTNLALSLSTEDKKTTTMLGISTFPDGKRSSEQSLNNKHNTEEPSTDANSIDRPIAEVPSSNRSLINRSISNGPSNGIDSMMIEPEATKREINTEPTGINSTGSLIYENKSPMLMVSSVTSHPIFETQSTTEVPSTDATSIKQSMYQGSSTSIYSMIEPETAKWQSNSESNGINATSDSSIYESPMVMEQRIPKPYRPVYETQSKGPSSNATSINQSFCQGPSTSIYSIPEYEATQLESNAEYTSRPTSETSIYETKSPMVMAVSIVPKPCRPVFDDSSGGEKTRSGKKKCCQLL